MSVVTDGKAPGAAFPGSHVAVAMVTAHPGGGYVILIAVLLQATVASVVLIVLPLLGPCGPAIAPEPQGTRQKRGVHHAEEHTYWDVWLALYTLAGAVLSATLATKAWLGYYAAHLHCVEINTSFYRLHGKGTEVEHILPPFVAMTSKKS